MARTDAYSQTWKQFLNQLAWVSPDETDGSVPSWLEAALSELSEKQLEIIFDELNEKLNSNPSHEELWEFFDEREANITFDSHAIKIFLKSILFCIGEYKINRKINRKGFYNHEYENWLELKSLGGPEAGLEFKIENFKN